MAMIDYTVHKELWGWLSEHPNRDIRDWTGWIQNGGEHWFNAEIPLNYIWECRNHEQLDINTHCKNCPFGNFEKSHCLGGLVLKYFESEGEERAKLARKVRDLPLRTDIDMVVL